MAKEHTKKEVRREDGVEKKIRGQVSRENSKKERERKEKKKRTTILFLPIQCQISTHLVGLLIHHVHILLPLFMKRMSGDFKEKRKEKKIETSCSVSSPLSLFFISPSYSSLLSPSLSFSLCFHFFFLVVLFWCLEIAVVSVLSCAIRNCSARSAGSLRRQHLSGHTSTLR